MTAPRRIKLTIDTLRVHGMNAVDAQLLATALQSSLQTHLSNHLGTLSGTDSLRLTLPPGSASTRGAALGTQIGAALINGGSAVVTHSPANTRAAQAPIHASAAQTGGGL